MSLLIVALFCLATLTVLLTAFKAALRAESRAYTLPERGRSHAIMKEKPLTQTKR